MKNVQTEFIWFTAVAAFGLLTLVTPLGVRSALAETAREACTHDAFRLCSDAIPDVEKTKACLARNQTSLSPLCKMAFGSARPLGHRHRRSHGRHRRRRRSR